MDKPKMKTTYYIWNPDMKTVNILRWENDELDIKFLIKKNVHRTWEDAEKFGEENPFYELPKN
jgi:hypothetical protein